MAAVKLVVMYPRPSDIDAFELRYRNEHVPMAVEKMVGKTKIVATKAVGSPQGTPLYHRIAEIHFPSMKDLEACASSQGAKETLAHAFTISTGGPPVILVAEEETFNF
ncbi:MAG: EthD family reductase [Terriglobia bacterium]